MSARVLETHLGWAAGWLVGSTLQTHGARLLPRGSQVGRPEPSIATPVFDGAREDELVLVSGLNHANGGRPHAG